MRILGVDPGLTRCGVGVIDAGPGRSATFVSVDVLMTPTDAPLSLRLRDINRGLIAAIDTHRPDVIALERVFAQHNVRTVMGTAQASGVLLASAGERDIPVTLHTPSEVKAAVTGTGRATKAQVAYAVRQVLGLSDERLLADATDALALSLCAAWRGAAGAASLPGATKMTPAQQKWREAESRAGRGKQGT